MVDATWLGSPAPYRLVAACRERGIRLQRSGPDTGVHVVFTRQRTRVPRAPAAARWIWCAAGPVDDARRVAAVLRGAYDVIDVRGADAPAQLAARIEELSVPAA